MKTLTSNLQKNEFAVDTATKAPAPIMPTAKLRVRSGVRGGIVIGSARRAPTGPCFPSKSTI